jgi:hypothetical protein
MTFVWKHPSKYKKFKEDQKKETPQESENNQDKETSEEQLDLQSQDKS